MSIINSRFRKLQYVFLLTFFLFITLLIPVLSSLPASAAAGDGLASTYGIPVVNGSVNFTAADIKSATWINANQITVTFAKGETAEFFPANGRLQDERLGSQDDDEGKVTYVSTDIGCYARINIYLNPNDKSATEFIMAELRDGEIDIDFKPSIDSECINKNNPKINFTDPQNRTAYFTWIDSGTIALVDGKTQGGKFTRASATSNYFWKDSEGPESACRDKIQLDPATDKVKFFELGTKYSGDLPGDVANTVDGDCKYNTSGFPPSNTAILVAAKDKSGDPAGSGDQSLFQFGSGVDTGPSCETIGGSLSWLLCPLLDVSDKAFSWLDQRIISALNVNSNYYNTPGVYGAWANIRNVAYLLLIPILLIMVIGTALGFSFIDAYTVKRALPRLLVAIIFIALSFEVTSLLIELSNIVGRGTAGLIAAPFGGIEGMQLTDIFDAGLQNDIGLVGAGIVGGIIAFLSGVTLWGIAITLGIAVLTMVVVFVLLTVREMLIIFLMIMAPIAILAWIFPGNDKPWKLWWGTFSKMLIFFPLIMALIVSGRAFASVVQSTGSDESTVITTMIKLIAFVAPYFFIPMAFKFAGSALGNLAGIVNSKEKGIFDRAKNLRGGLAKSKRHRIAEGNAFQNAPDNSRRSRINTLGQKAYLMPKTGFGMRKGAMGAAMTEAEVEEWKKANDDTGLQAVIANDDAAAAGMYGRGTRDDAFAYLTSLRVKDANGKESQKYTEETANQIADQVTFAKRRVGSQTFRSQAVVAQAGSKTSFRGGPAEMLAAIGEASEGNSQLAATLYASARGKAEQAGRLDLAAYSYGEGLGVLSKIMNATDPTEKQKIANEANDYLLDKGLHSKGSGQIWGSHGTSVKNFAQTMNRKYTKAVNTRELAEAEYKKAPTAQAKIDLDIATEQEMYALAELSNANDQIAYFSPENADYFNKEIFGAIIKNNDGTTKMRSVNGDPIYKTTYKEDPMTGKQILVPDSTGKMVPQIIKQELVGYDTVDVPDTVQSRVDKARNSGDEAFRRRTRALSEAELERMRREGGPKPAGT